MRLPELIGRKVWMTSNQHGPYVWGYTHDTMVDTKCCQPAMVSESHKVDLSPDCRLQLAYMKLELLVIVYKDMAR